MQSSPATSPRVDALLREATRDFDAPVALVAPCHIPAGEPPLRAFASAAITSPAGEPLGTLCILGTPDLAKPPTVELTRLDELAAEIGIALSAAAASPPTTPDLRSSPHAPGSPP